MIKSYVRYRRFALYLSGSCFAVFAVMMTLVRVEKMYIFYAMLIFAFIAAVFFIFDFTAYKERLTALREIKDNLTLIPLDFPEAGDDMQTAYRETIFELYRNIQRETSRASTENAELVDYYTMWLHQIKTPISAIYLAAGAKEPSPEIIRQELFKIEQYVDMALQYARLDRGIADILGENCALDTIIKDAVKKYSSLFIYKRLSLNYEKTNAVVLSDKKWLSFILEQLLSNALKYTNKGGITVSFGGRRLTVADTGIGIRADDLKRIFEKGYTGYNGRLEKKSSGLGLYMAARAAAKIGVKLEIESVQNEGTKAYIIFGEGVSK